MVAGTGKRGLEGGSEESKNDGSGDATPVLGFNVAVPGDGERKVMPSSVTCRALETDPRMRNCLQLDGCPTSSQIILTRPSVPPATQAQGPSGV